MAREHQSQQEEAKKKAERTAEQAQQKAGETAEQAKEQARSQAARQKERATESMQGVAQALRQTGDNLHEQDQNVFGRYANQAADQVERFAGYLRNRSPEELLSEAQRYARREPALFLGGAFALGVLGARFLRSSSPPSSSGRYRAPRHYRGEPAVYDTPSHREHPSVSSTSAPAHRRSTYGETQRAETQRTSTPEGSERVGGGMQRGESETSE